MLALERCIPCALLPFLGMLGIASLPTVDRRAERCCCSSALTGRGGENSPAGPVLTWIYTNLHTSVRWEQLGKRETLQNFVVYNMSAPQALHCWTHPWFLQFAPFAEELGMALLSAAELTQNTNVCIMFPTGCDPSFLQIIAKFLGGCLMVLGWFYIFWFFFWGGGVCLYDFVKKKLTLFRTVL